VSTTITRTTTFVVVDCPSCGLLFAITNEFQHRRSEDGKGFYCPVGHNMSYHETDVDRLRKRAEKAERDAANAKEDARVERAAKIAMKGQLTKAQHRADRGVCQHCHRSFVNVQRHVASQHKEVMA
jgi:adenine-specific DNA methylase